MNWKSNKVVIPAVAIAALTLGFAAGGGEPETKVETKTETVTKTVEATPDSCIEALDAAEALVHGPVVEQSEDTIVLIGLIEKAFNAGIDMDNTAAQEVISTMEDLNARAADRNKTIDSIVSEYNAAAEDCRASGDGSNA